MDAYNVHLADRILRAYGPVLSDEDLKTVEASVNIKRLAAEILRRGPPFNTRQIDILTKVAGDMDDDHSFEKDGHVWRDDVLDKYADHILNYKYTYNNEAKKLDPGIDTEKEHVGPMAQDIEKVNASAVIDDPKTGYKSVDTGRLALMNAGAIAELARQVREMQNA